MTDGLLTPQNITGEIVLTERIVSTEYIITDIHESIINKFVRVEVELGPFSEETFPDGSIIKRGSSRRNLNVWNGDDYVAIANTWNNADLITAVHDLLSEEAASVK